MIKIANSIANTNKTGKEIDLKTNKEPDRTLRMLQMIDKLVKDLDCQEQVEYILGYHPLYEAFSKMKESALFINVGRGPIVNEADLVRALEEDLIAGAGLDVMSSEPLPIDNPLLKIQDSRKLLLTPHIAWASMEARNCLVEELALNLEAYLRGESRNSVVGK